MKIMISHDLLVYGNTVD